MTDNQDSSRQDPEIKNPYLDPHNNKDFSFQDLLIHAQGILKDILSRLSAYLDSYMQVNETSLSFIELIHRIEDISAHFKFTMAINKSQNEQEVAEIKRRFPQLEKEYEKIKVKEDIAVLQGKETLLIFYERVFVKLYKMARSCFRRERHGGLLLEKPQENLALIKISIKRIENYVLHYPLVLTAPKDDIFSSPKTSEVWKELYQYATIKQNLTKQQVHLSSKRFHMIIHASYIALKQYSQQKNASDYELLYNIAKKMAYYGTRESQAELEALLVLLNPSLEEAFNLWLVPERPIVAKFLTVRYPMVGYDERIYVPRLFPQITKQVILQEYQEDTINKMNLMDPALLKGPDLSANREKIKKELFISDESKIPIRVLFHNYLNFKGEHPDTIPGFARKVASSFKNSFITPENDITGVIIVHIHGGGFVSHSSQTYRINLNRWVNSLKLIHFSIDYRLAPKNKYPDALDDVWQAYLWILNYSEEILGIKKKKIIIVSDSAGANLCLGLSLRLIRAGYQPPDGCLLIYPCVLVDPMASSPSYFKSVDDILLPTSLLKLVAEAYVGKEFKNLEDPFISPLVASDELLKKLPPIRMLSGMDDPLHDDCWRFLSRLIKLKKNVRLIAHEHLTHGYLGHYELKDFEVYVEEACELIRELINCDSDSEKI